MNKGEFVRAIAEEGQFSIKDAEKAYNAFVGTVQKTLKKGEAISLVGFGTFQIKTRAARTGINPLTKEKIKIKASKAPSLKFGKAFKETL